MDGARIGELEVLAVALWVQVRLCWREEETGGEMRRGDDENAEGVSSAREANEKSTTV